MIDQIMLAICQKLGIDPVAMASLIPLVVIVCNLIGRAIPDTATGWLGLVRKFTKVIGLYVSNRIDSGISVNTAARIVTNTPSPGEEDAQPVNQTTIPPTNFGNLKSHWIAGIMSLLMLLMLGFSVSACATIQSGLGHVGDYVCSHQPEVRLAATSALDRAQQIDDSTKRAIAIAAADTMLASLDQCPVITSSTSAVSNTLDSSTEN